MRYISICSGIEAATVAFHPLGWEPLAFSEIDKFPSRVLAHHYPNVPNLGDMTKYRDWPIELLSECDLIVGGCPCQAFSVAGLRNSLDDERGNLTIVYTHMIDHIDAIRSLYGKPPVIVIYENVPGILSTHDGAFGCFLAGLAGEDDQLIPAGKRWTDAGIVYGPQRTIAWRVADAQYFALAQRRRRVFVVASAREGFDPAAVLFECEGVRRDTPPSREAGQEPAAYTPSSINAYREWPGTLRASGGDYGGGSEGLLCMSTGQAGAEIGIGIGTTLNCNHEAPIVAFKPGQSASARSIGAQEEIACTLESAGGGNNRQAVAYGLAGSMINRQEHNGPNGSGIYPEFCPTQTKCDVHAVAYPINTLALGGRPDPKNDARMTMGVGADGDPQFTLQSAHCHAVATAMQVRRLTPTECERLQGFTNIKKECIVSVWNCSDLQKINAVAETRCHRLPNSATGADESELNPSVNAAEHSLNTSQVMPSAPVLVNVQIDLERKRLQILSHGKLLWSASIAEKQGWFLPHIQPEDFAQLVAKMLTLLEQTTPAGRVGLPPNTRDFSVPLSGKHYVNLFGDDIIKPVNDVEQFTNIKNDCLKFTTSQAGQSSPSCDQRLRTLCCFVTSVIASSIPEITSPTNSYAVSIQTTNGYTNIPWRNKQSEDCPDGPRYKALGNSMAVPVMAFIGRRICSQY